jgi:hypothetical protein
MGHQSRPYARLTDLRQYEEIAQDMVLVHDPGAI